jgi:CheY-like chemotaxis protein
MPDTSSNARILVVEDNDGDVFLIQKALREHGICAEVSVCEDGESAVRLLWAMDANSAPDAIILDLALPRVEGAQVLGGILSHPALAEVPVMVFTSSPSPADRHRVELLGSVRYLQKPSGLDNFLHLVGQNVKEMLAHTGRRSGPPART